MLTHHLLAVLGTFSRILHAGSSSDSVRSTPDVLLVSRGAPNDLGTVLANNGNITTYTKLIKNNTDFLLQLPSEKGVTIIAPSDDAFQKYQGLDPKNQSQVLSLLKYHTIEGTVSIASVPSGPSTFEPTLLADPVYTNVTGGQNVIINQQAGGDVVFTTGDGSRSTVLYEDIAFNGGNLQIVDTLLVPPTRLEHTALSAYLDLSAFVAALYAANLISTFSNTPDVTIFAPRMAAFQRLAGTLEALSPSELARLLSYHIVIGTVIPSAKLTNDTNLETPAIPFGLAGAPVAPAGVATLPLHLTRSGNNLYVNSAQVIQPDILIANGVVHMIDNLLDPNATAALPDPNLTAQPPVMPIASPSNTGKAAGTPFASALPCTASCPVTTSKTTARASSTTTGAALTGTGTGAAMAGPRCTGLAGMGMVGAAAGACLLGFGVL